MNFIVISSLLLACVALIGGIAGLYLVRQVTFTEIDSTEKKEVIGIFSLSVFLIVLSLAIIFGHML